MIKNGKYFVAPQRTSEDFKELFARLAASGAGRPVDQQGFADGPWTPASLADAICSIEANRNGIELRAVQIWFQDNCNGISNENTRWLARIFGCDDPDAASFWQAELKASNDRLAAKRRAQRARRAEAPINGVALRVTQSDEPGTVRVSPSVATSMPADGVRRAAGRNLALRAEAMFAGPNSLNLPVVIWGCLGVLWLLTYSLGVHSVTYSPLDGIDKQVGFIWSAGWNFGDPVFLPLILITVSRLLNSWQRGERAKLISAAEATGLQTWHQRVATFSLSFWAILLICFALIFLVQWAGVYLHPLLIKYPDVVMIDWILIALVRPEVLSTNAAIVLSFFAFLYSGMIYWFFFNGLLLLYAIAGDFADICSARQAEDHQAFSDCAVSTGLKIANAVFRCTVFGILMALTIKINAAYLVSDAENVISWMIDDASAALGLQTDRWKWIGDSPSPFFTSFLQLFLLCFVFGACLMPIKLALDQSVQNDREKRNTGRILVRMTSVVAILAAGYLLVGQFYGFSIVLVLTTGVSLVSVFQNVEAPDRGPQGV